MVGGWWRAGDGRGELVMVAGVIVARVMMAGALRARLKHGLVVRSSSVAL